MVGAVLEQFAHRRVHSDGDVFARRVAGLLDGFEEDLYRVFVGRQVRGEAAFLAHGGAEAAVVEHLLQRVVGLGAPPQCLAEAGRSHRHYHEFLHVDRVVGVGATVDDVHHRHRQHVGVRPAEVAPQGQLEVIGGRLRHSQAGAEDGVGAEPALVVRSVQRAEPDVDRPLFEGIDAVKQVGDFTVHETDSGVDALAQVTAPAVAQFDGLVLAGGGTRRYRGPPGGPAVQGDLDFDCRVASRIEDFTAGDADDLAHVITVANGVLPANTDLDSSPPSTCR